MGTNGEILRLQAQCMCRIAEVAHMAWAELDLEEGRWVLPAERAKNGHEHLILLPAQAIAFLRDHKAEQKARSIDSPFVFPQRANPAKPTRSETVIHAWADQREALNLPKSFKTHSLRHAALTWAAEYGATKDLRDRVSNHVSKARDADSIYVAAQLNQPARVLWQQWADYLDQLVQPNIFQMGCQARLG
jgi:integrase